MKRSIRAAALWMLVLAATSCVFHRAREPVSDIQVSRKWDRAEALLKEGKSGEALKLYEAIAQGMVENRFTAHAYLRMGTILSSQGDWAAAREALIEAMRTDSTGDLKAHTNYYLGIAEYRLKDYDEARSHLSTHLALMPASASRALVLEELGEIDLAQGHPLLALMRFSQAIEASADPQWNARMDEKIADLTAKKLDRPELAQVANLYAGTIIADRAALRLAEKDYLDSKGSAESRANLEGIIVRRRGERIAEEASSLLARMREQPIPPAGAASAFGAVPAPASAYSPAMPDLALAPLPPLALPPLPAGSADLKTVGCALPLTGRYAAYGEKALRGILLAAGTFGAPDPSDSPALGVRWIVKDTRGDPVSAQMAIEELAQVHGAVAAIGPMVTAEVAAAGPRAEDLGMPIVTFARKEATPAKGRYVLRNSVPDDKLVHALAELAVKDLGIHRFAVLYPKDADGEAAKILFLHEAALAGGEIVAAEPYDPSATDFSEVIAKLIHARKEETKRVGDDLVVGFDALYLPDSAQKVALIAPQLAYHDLNGIQLLGTSRLNTPKLVKMAGSYVQGALFVDIFSPSSADPSVASFVQAYRTAYGEAPGILEALAYETARAILETLSRPGVRSRAELRDGLFLAPDFRGVTGLTRFDANGEALHGIQVLTVQGDGIVEVRWPVRVGGAPRLPLVTY